MYINFSSNSLGYRPACSWSRKGGNDLGLSVHHRMYHYRSSKSNRQRCLLDGCFLYTKDVSCGSLSLAYKSKWGIIGSKKENDRRNYLKFKSRLIESDLIFKLYVRYGYYRSTCEDRSWFKNILRKGG